MANTMEGNPSHPLLNLDLDNLDEYRKFKALLNKVHEQAIMNEVNIVKFNFKGEDYKFDRTSSEFTMGYMVGHTDTLGFL
jgi:hypothetical protein